MIYLVWLRSIPETILSSSIPAKFSIGRLPLARRQESSYFSPRFEDFEGARRKMPILGTERRDPTHFKLDGIRAYND